MDILKALNFITENPFGSFILSLIPMTTVGVSVFLWATQKNRLYRYIFGQLGFTPSQKDAFKSFKKELKRYIPHHFLFAQETIGYQDLLRRIRDKKRSQKYIFIFGKAGVGKSVLTKRLALDLRNKFSHKKENSDLDIVYIRLSGKLTVEDIIEQIKDLLHSTGPQKPIVIMDGLDEINLLGSQSADSALMEICTVLNKLSGQFEKFIISSRPEIFSKGRKIVEEISFDADKRFEIYTVRDFTPEQSINLYKALPHQDKRSKVKRFEKLVKENHNTVFSIPFLVTQADALFAMFRDEQIVELGKSGNRYLLYQSIVDYALIRERDILLPSLDVDESRKKQLRNAFKSVGKHLLGEIAQYMRNENKSAIQKTEADAIVERVYNEHSALLSSVFAGLPCSEELFLTRFLVVQKNDGTEYEFIHNTIYELFVGSECLDKISDRREKAAVLRAYQENKNSIVYSVYYGKKYEVYKHCLADRQGASGVLSYMQFLNLLDGADLIFGPLPAGLTLQKLALEFPCTDAFGFAEIAGISVDDCDRLLSGGRLSLCCRAKARIEPLLGYVETDQIKEVRFDEAVVEDLNQLKVFPHLERLDLGRNFQGDVLALLQPFKLAGLTVPCTFADTDKAACIQKLFEITEKLYLYVENFSPWYEVIYSFKREKAYHNRIYTANITNVNRYAEGELWRNLSFKKLYPVFAMDCEYILQHKLFEETVLKFHEHWFDFLQGEIDRIIDGDTKSGPGIVDLAQCIDWFSHVYLLQGACLGEYNASALLTGHWLGSTYSDRGEDGDYTRAIAVLADVYEKRKEVLGEKHRDTLNTGNWLGGTYSKRGEDGDYTRAIAVLADVYEKRKEVLGEKHRDTLNTGHWLGSTYYKRGEDGDYTRAIAVLADVYEKRKEVLGETHSLTLKTGYHLAKTYQQMQNREAAIPIIEEVYTNLQKCEADIGTTREDVESLYHSLLGQ